jgi:hypothetical protein
MYNYLLSKQYEARGYRWNPIPLPSYLSFDINTENESKYVTVYSTIHVNKQVRLGNSWSTEFTDEAIIKDVGATIIKRYGLRMSNPSFE